MSKPIWTAPPDTDPEWRARAACSLADVALFDRAGRDGAEYKQDRSDARYKCLRCPVLIACRDDVMRTEHTADHRGRDEFRAGLTPRERGALYKRQRQAAAEAKRAADAAALDAAERAT